MGPLAEKSILAVGMLPPPLGGQAMMFEWAIEGLSDIAQVDVIDLQAQRNIGSSGKFSAPKLLVFLKILTKCLSVLISGKKYDVLYYCPSGPSKIGLLKDLVILTLLRWRARSSVFHFHATGGIQFLLGMHPVIVWYARKVIFGPDMSIRCAKVSPNDAKLCASKRQKILPNGIPDPIVFSPFPPKQANGPKRFCFIGALTAEKGIFDLLKVAQILKEKKLDFELDIIGEGTPDEMNRMVQLIEKYRLSENVVLHGVLSGKDKFDVLSQADLFLFPTYFRAETQPLVVIEAAALGIPVIASDWRGLSSIVEEGKTGYLLPPRNPKIFAEKIIEVLESGSIGAMKLAARERFLENFTQAAFLESLNKTIVEVISESAARSARQCS